MLSEYRRAGVPVHGGLIPGAPHRAVGGPVASGSPYWVGERGPELFVPKTSGSIVPAGATGGVTVNVYGSVLSTQRELATLVEEAMMRTYRQGGNRQPVCMATLQPGEKGRMYALGGIMRGGASRGGYVDSRVYINIDGDHIGWAPDDDAHGVLLGTLTISDILDETPNTCSFRVNGYVPEDGAELIITRGSKNSLQPTVRRLRLDRAAALCRHAAQRPGRRARGRLHLAPGDAEGDRAVPQPVRDRDHPGPGVAVRRGQWLHRLHGDGRPAGARRRSRSPMRTCRTRSRGPAGASARTGTSTTARTCMCSSRT